MASERDRMLAGEPYDPLDPDLVRPGQARDRGQPSNATRVGSANQAMTKSRNTRARSGRCSRLG